MINRVEKLVERMEEKLASYDEEVLGTVREMVKLSMDDVYYYNGLLMNGRNRMITDEEAKTMLDIIRKGKDASTAEMMIVDKTAEIVGGMLSK